MASRNLLEKELDELYKEVKAGEKLGSQRRYFAYFLKIIAGGAGLVIATGFVSEFDQVLGAAVLVAVFLDQVFSNHLRLIAETKAAHAYKVLSRRVKGNFNSNRGAVVNMAKNGDVDAEKELEKMMLDVHSELSKGIADIEAGLADAGIKALQVLSLEAEGK